ncbi:MAG: hypothetical protein K0R57_1656 [Paenibacillaceae bacterium]|jgi:hypothetical protein|nr:hypothetical protein [Paenibacillaceae bacterium]
MQYWKNTHDLRLPEWGPYTKTYIGVSHIADHERGIRFDLSLFPGFYRRKIDVPSVLWESGYHPWDAAPDLSSFVHRHELEWKDRIYADISYSHLTERSRLVRCECVNNTEIPQNLVLHYVASLNFPQLCSHGPVLEETELHIPDSLNVTWVDALDYDELQFAVPRPQDGLGYDGFHRGEKRLQNFVKGSGLAQGFGKDSGDRAVYSFSLQEGLPDAMLIFRFRGEPGCTPAFRAEGLIRSRLAFKGTGQIEQFAVQVGSLPAGDHLLELISEGATPIELDGFVLADASAMDRISFRLLPRNPVPDLEPGPCPGTLLLQYEGVQQVYGLYWEDENALQRQLYASELDRFLRFKAHDHVNAVLRDKEQTGHYTNICMSLFMKPRSTVIRYGMVCCGTKDEVTGMLREFNRTKELAEAHYQDAAVKRQRPPASPDGDKYGLSQRLMEATLATNVVFPVYTKRSYIRHYTPGRWWDSLYTWDSGFIGIGLCELSTELAADCLNAYVTEPGDPCNAFIHHGSMVPVQIYLFHELWNRTQSRDWLEHFYPRLKQYYEFYAGKTGGSTTGSLGSGLLKPWDYFYNSGGWDDYPPQTFVHKHGLRDRAAPLSNTCHAIRMAKLLAFAAEALGDREQDIRAYSEDITRFTLAVNRYAWDNEAGYYGYVLHDETGEACELLRDEGGANYNMGLDGAYPLVAGAAPAERGSRLIGHLTDSDRIWCPIGLSTVDQSAPYFTPDGYWNGAVWMPHQWFYWKTMLDLGRGDIAWRIASTALELWKREVEETYNCYEHFIVETGRGAGWHQFGGLSAPVLNWFSAYYRPGRITAGFDTWIELAQFEADDTEAIVRLAHMPNLMSSPFTVLVRMNPAHCYNLTEIGGEGGILISDQRLDGLLEVTFPAHVRRAELKVSRRDG